MVNRHDWKTMMVQPHADERPTAPELNIPQLHREQLNALSRKVSELEESLERVKQQVEDRPLIPTIDPHAVHIAMVKKALLEGGAGIGKLPKVTRDHAVAFLDTDLLCADAD